MRHKTHIKNPIIPLVGGIISLMVAMGVGRFAYTPILPIMQSHIHFSETMAGYLASSNYLGYLLGALSASMFAWRKGKSFYVKVYLVINILTTILMGTTENFIYWSILRFVSGFSSGVVFVFIAGIVLDYLEQRGRTMWSGFFYSGVGIGIFLTGLIVPVLNDFWGWQWTWVGLGFIAMCMGAFPLLLTRDAPSLARADQSAKQIDDSARKKGLLIGLIVSYGCEGMGYIVSGTFLVAMVGGIPGLGTLSALSWAFVGVAAAPSCWIWSVIAKKYSNIAALYAAYIAQMIGIILPVVFPNTIGVLAGALLFGATFMGITMLTIAEARSVFPQQSSKIIGYLTVAYGIGQIIGPIVAGVLTTRTGSYNSALLFASITLLSGMLFLSAKYIRRVLQRNLE